MATILDGKKLRDKILLELKTKIDSMDSHSPIKPKLVVILVGENPASQIYVNTKKKIAEKIGIISEVVEYPKSVHQEELISKIESLNDDKSVTAILVQLPLPEHIDKQKILNTINPKKDVDGLTDYNSAMLFHNEVPYAYPCTPKGIIRLLDEYKIEIEGKHAVVIGRSNLVGKPLAQMLLNRNATVTVCHSHTKNITDIIKTADILISAVGKKIVGEKMIKSGCVVVDVGIFKDSNNKTTGDVDFDKVMPLSSYISPVPGGVGPMTIASLMSNTVDLFDKQHISPFDGSISH
jgi:methylenetetrahydrofolate dehydrogenase (NADP+) / methenyltetrahydrofolate cyclohydrolase